MEQLKATEITKERLESLQGVAEKMLVAWHEEFLSALEDGRIAEDELELFEQVLSNTEQNMVDAFSKEGGENEST